MDILEINTAEELFGEDPSGVDKKYKELVKVFHPDVGGKTSEFQHLQNLYALAKTRIEEGVYGTDKRASSETFRISSKRVQYDVSMLLRHQDDVSNYYNATYEGSKKALVKIARRPDSNPLLVNEAQTLKKLLSNTSTYDALSPHLLEYRETFGYRTPGEKPHQVVVFENIEEPLYTLKQVKERYGVLPPRHAAWIFRRVLFALAEVHMNEIVHGAILPQNVLIQPENHGVVLANWFHSTAVGETMKSIPAGARLLYPPEVLNKEPVTGATDVYMAARLLGYLGDDKLPAFTAFEKGCTFERQRMRPSAETAFNEFTQLIDSLWERKFVPFYM